MNITNLWILYGFFQHLIWTFNNLNSKNTLIKKFEVYQNSLIEEDNSEYTKERKEITSFLKSIKFNRLKSIDGWFIVYLIN